MKLRCDLEFYIPQLIAQYLRSDLKGRETAKLREFILECSRLSLFFAHRVYWYLKASSLVDTDSEEGQYQMDCIVQLVTSLEITVFGNNQELLYVANSDNLLKSVVRAGLGEELLE